MTHSTVVRGCLVAALVVTLAGCGASTPRSAPVASPTPSPTNAPTASPTPGPTSSAPASEGLPPEGTWQIHVTADDLIAAGWPADLSPWGTYTWTFAGDRATIELLADDGGSAYCAAEMTAVDGQVNFDYDPAGGDCGDLNEVLDWEFDDDGLHLFPCLHGLSIQG